MGDMREVFDAMKEERRERKARELPGRIAEIYALIDHGFKVRKIADYQYRVNDKLDLFPVRGRYHLIPENRRGNYLDRELPKFARTLLRTFPEAR